VAQTPLPFKSIGLSSAGRWIVALLALGIPVQSQATSAATLSLHLGGFDSDDRALTLGLVPAPPSRLGLDPDAGETTPFGPLKAVPEGGAEAAGPAGGVPPRAMPSLGGFPQRVWQDFTVLATRPLSFDSRDWTTLALGTGLVGVAAGFDNRLRDTVQAHNNPSTRSLANRIRPIGNWAGPAAMGVLFGAGELFGNANLAATGADGIEASLFAGGIITPVFKEVVGRSRPISGADNDQARLFSGGQSFPSGEATEAFTLAAVVSSHTDSLPLQGLSWALAGLVGWERMQLDAHWASDVVAGALIGIVVGRWVSDRGRAESADHPTVAIQPAVGTKALGVNATLSW
jgi:membrane-associated phospholipid phosphatase